TPFSIGIGALLYASWSSIQRFQVARVSKAVLTTVFVIATSRSCVVIHQLFIEFVITSKTLLIVVRKFPAFPKLSTLIRQPKIQDSQQALKPLCWSEYLVPPDITSICAFSSHEFQTSTLTSFLMFHGRKS